MALRHLRFTQTASAVIIILMENNGAKVKSVRFPLPGAKALPPVARKLALIGLAEVLRNSTNELLPQERLERCRVIYKRLSGV